MTVLGLEDKTVKKAAALFVQGAPVSVICFAIGVDADFLTKLVDTPEFQNELAASQFEENKKQALMDQGWDAIEQLSIKTVVDHLSGNAVDPEFALRAGMLANRAERRSKNNRTLDSNVGNGGTVVINMTKRFVTNINNGPTMINVPDRSQETLPPKRQLNILSPGKVEKLLDMPAKSDEEVFQNMVGKLLA